MAARRTVSRGTARRSPRRKLVWARVTGLNVDITAGTATFTNALATFETAYGASLLGCTIMRVRGMIYPGTQADGGVIVAGLRVMEDSEFTVGYTAAAGPGTDLHADWMYWEAIPSSRNEGHYFDVRAMRKIDELSQGLLFSISCIDTTVVDLDFALSILVALP